MITSLDIYTGDDILHGRVNVVFRGEEGILYHVIVMLHIMYCIVCTIPLSVSTSDDIGRENIIKDFRGEEGISYILRNGKP